MNVGPDVVVWVVAVVVGGVDPTVVVSVVPKNKIRHTIRQKTFKVEQ